MSPIRNRGYCRPLPDVRVDRRGEAGVEFRY
jgi:hypothetical protein